MYYILRGNTFRVSYRNLSFSISFCYMLSCCLISSFSLLVCYLLWGSCELLSTSMRVILGSTMMPNEGTDEKLKAWTGGHGVEGIHSLIGRLPTLEIDIKYLAFLESEVQEITQAITLMASQWGGSFLGSSTIGAPSTPSTMPSAMVGTSGHNNNEPQTTPVVSNGKHTNEDEIRASNISCYFELLMFNGNILDN